MRVFTAILVTVSVCAPPMAVCAQSSWSAPTEVVSLNSTTQDYYPHISADGTTIRIASSRTDVTGWVGGWDVNFATRTGRNQPWSGFQVEPGMNSTSNDLSPHVLAGDLVAYIASLRPGTGSGDIYRMGWRWEFTGSGVR